MSTTAGYGSVNLSGDDQRDPAEGKKRRARSAEREAAVARDLLAGFAERSADAIVATRPDGTVIVWNAGAEALYGWTPQEMLGQSVQRVLPPESRAESEDSYDRARRGETLRESVARRVRKDGRILDVAFTLTPVVNPRGDVQGLVSVERDVTRRRRLEALAEGQRRVLEALSESGRLQDALRDLLATMLDLTGHAYEAAIMVLERERLLLVPAATRLPDALERRLAEGIPVAPGGHPAGEAAFQRQAVSAADLRATTGWPALRDAMVEAGLHSCCSTPICAPGGEVLGTLDLYGREVGEPGGEDLEVLSALSRTAALAIQRHETERELVRGREVLLALNEINALLVADLDIGRILRRVTEEATRLLGAQMGAFLTSPTEPGAVEFQLHTLIGPRRANFSEVPMPRGTALFSGTLNGRAVQRFSDVTRDPRYGKNEPYQGVPSGHPAVRSFMSAPVSARSGEVIGMLLFGHEEPGRFARWHEDILRGAAAQMALALDSANLYRQASERAEALSLADKRKDEFLAMLGHELRNPLGAMIAGLAVIQSGLPDHEEDANEAMHIFRRQSRHMQRLIDDLMDVNRISHGQIQLRREPIDAVAAVREAVETGRIPALKMHQQITFEAPRSPIWIEVDPVRVEQVVGNLLNNAMKFSPRGTTIRVTVDTTGNEASIVVKDDGRGIPPEDLQHVFDMFVQVRRTDGPGPGGGLGLGLTLVQEIVQLHGGWVTARSEGDGHGSEFEVRLPLTEAPPMAEAEGEEPVYKGPAPILRVLLAEDQPDAARAMAMLLRHWGHKVAHADDGKAALELARRRRPDVCLLDIGLPGMDGWAVARAIREMPELKGVRLAALSGLGQDYDVAASDAAGFDRHFVKPVDPDALRVWLETIETDLTSA
jgi:PAS domain S-box-containing protein